MLRAIVLLPSVAMCSYLGDSNSQRQEPPSDDAPTTNEGNGAKFVSNNKKANAGRGPFAGCDEGGSPLTKLPKGQNEGAESWSKGASFAHACAHYHPPSPANA
eukprot:1161489-Pelagomonas_calceolata.AAC.12